MFVVLALGVVAAPALSERRAAVVVAVTAGKPTEFDFRVSTSRRTPAAHVTFKVTNAGKLVHSFEVCTKPVFGAPKSSCPGRSTGSIRPGGSATLTVGFAKSGTYEFLSSLAGQAALGMVGTITVVVPAKPSVASNQGAAGGATLFEQLGCAGCHTAVEAQAAGNVTPTINETHSGGPFPDGPLTRKQIDELASYLNI